jgi:hypothetical protein
MYTCDICNYKTTNIGNLNKHNSTKKHLDAVIKIQNKKTRQNSCKHCNKLFNSKSSKWRHEQHCDKITKNILNQQIPNYEDLDKSSLIKMLLTNQQNQINQQKELIDKLVTSNTAISETSNKSVDVASKSMSILKYATIHMPDAPPLDEINEEEAIGILNYKGNDKKLNNEQQAQENELYVGTTLAHYNNKNLVNLLGDMIVAYFRKPGENVRKSSCIWAVDVARLSFIIMQTINKNGDKQWRDDKTGKLFQAMVIQPMLKALHNILKAFIKYKDKWQKNNKNICIDEMNKVMEMRQSCIELMKDIRYGRLEKPLLRSVAPSFQFNDFMKNCEK